MPIEIKHRITGVLLLKLASDALQHADLRYANLQHADLQHADLRYANLQHADLRYANLQHADLQHADLQHADLQHADLQHADLQHADLQHADLRYSGLMIYQFRKYTAYIQLTYTRIGCQYHTNEDWFNFTDDEIERMDIDALTYWKQAKPIIQAMVASLQKDEKGE